TSVLDELSNWLPSHPEDVERLDDLQFVSRVVQESLRLHPAPPATGRVALEDVELSWGERLEAGRWVAVMIHEANRDRTVFGEDADEFDPHRSLPTGIPAYGLSFSA